jgi:hypothetical protein
MCKNFRHLRALLLVGSVVTALAILAIPSAACAQDAGTSAAIVTIKEAANGICGTVKQEGNSTDMGANGTIGGNVNLNVGGFLKNLIGKLIEGSASISGAWKDEYYQGVLRGQLAAVINKNTDCRMEVLNLLSGSLLHTTIVPDRGLCPQGSWNKYQCLQG